MDFGFEGFQTDDFDIDVEDFSVKKIRKFDRMRMVGRGGSVTTIPAFDDGVAYYGEANGYVFAVTCENGRVLWRFKTNDIIFGCSPVVRGGKVFIGSYDYNFYCLDSKTGKEIWKFRTGDRVFGPPNADNETVYFSSMDGYVYAADMKDGKELWRFKTGDMIGSCPVIYDGKVYIGSHDFNMYCLNAKNGREIWRFRTGGEIMNGPPNLIMNGVLYFGSFDNFLYAVDADTGKELWRFRTGEYGNSGSPVVHDNVMYFVPRDGVLYALNLEGKEIWRYRTSGVSTWQKPAVSGKGVLIISENGFLYHIGFDGREIFTKKVDVVMMPPAIYDNKIWLGTWECNMHVFDMEGNEIFRIPTSTKQQSFMPPPNDAFRAEIKKEARIEDAISDDSYKARKKGETVSLSDYQLSSDYATTSEYKQKSDYDTSFVMFEEIMEGGELWILDLKDLTPRILTPK
jgi:outer membrane protein assembly factor BamB